MWKWSQLRNIDLNPVLLERMVTSNFLRYLMKSRVMVMVLRDVALNLN